MESPLTFNTNLLQQVISTIGSIHVFSLAALLLTWGIYTHGFHGHVPKVAKIPEAPDSRPFIGNLGSLGGRLKQNDCTIYSKWSKQLASDIFQMRLGSERALVVNTFSAIKELWVGRANDLVDKPFQRGFAEYLEYDLSGASMTEPIKRCRQAAMRALGKPKWPGYYHLLEPYSVNLTRMLFEKGSNGKKHMDIYPYIRQVIFDLALSLTYGTRSKGIDDQLVNGLIESLEEISNLRASTLRFRDYVPLLRFICPDFAYGNRVAEAERRRQQYLDVIYSTLTKRITSGEEVSCIVNGLIDDDKLTEPEMHGTCKAILQAAPDTVASTMYLAIAWLSIPAGQEYQSELYGAILAAYEDDRDQAWNMAFQEEKVELLVSFYKEVMRFWTVTPFSLPRTASRDIKYRDTVIPKGITMIMNAQHANHDTEWFGNDAFEFKPTRFMGNPTSLPHLTFGAGARICPAAALSNRIMYALLVRLILAFQIHESPHPSGRKANVDWVNFSEWYHTVVALPKSFDCCFTARDEDWIRKKVA